MEHHYLFSSYEYRMEGDASMAINGQKSRKPHLSELFVIISKILLKTGYQHTHLITICNFKTLFSLYPAREAVSKGEIRRCQSVDQRATSFAAIKLHRPTRAARVTESARQRQGRKYVPRKKVTAVILLETAEQNG